MIKREYLSKIGQFAKPHGIKGEIALITEHEISDIPCDFYIVCDMDGIWVPFFVDSCRQKSNTVTLIKFDNIDTEEKVKILSGKEAYLPSEMILSSDDDAIDTEPITGYSIVDDNAGVIGQVIDIDDSTMNTLLKVDRISNEILIPVALITSINRESKTAYVTLPEDFLEI